MADGFHVFLQFTIKREYSSTLVAGKQFMVAFVFFKGFLKMKTFVLENSTFTAVKALYVFT